MGTVLGVVAIVLLVLANGFFVAAEFAYVAVDRNTLEGAGENDRSARRALAVLRRLSFMLSGAQLGITASSLLVGFIAEPVSRSALSPLLNAIGVGDANRKVIAVAAGFLLVTMGQMIVAELIPKNLAIARSTRVARLTARPMTLFMRAFGPLIGFFDAAAGKLLHSVGIEAVEELTDVISLEELDTIISESLKEGSLDAGQADLLEHVLAFRELRAADAATHRVDVETIEADATGEDLRELVGARHSRFPVMGEDDQVVGVVQAQALLDVERTMWASTPVSTMMQDAVVVAEAARLPSVLQALRAAGAEMAIVIDEYGDFFGVITVEDLAEELVGDIQDESDPEPPQVQHPSERVWTVPGSWRLDEIFEETGVELPDGPYETVAGLILTRLERMASVGDTVRFSGVRLRVSATQGRRITEVTLEASRLKRAPQ